MMATKNTTWLLCYLITCAQLDAAIYIVLQHSINRKVYLIYCTSPVIGSLIYILIHTWGTTMIDLPLFGNMICCNIISEFYLHAIPSYAWNDKHCYGGNKANDSRQDDNHINGHHSATGVLFPTSTHRKADWSVSHNTTGEVFLTLQCAAIDLLRHSSCW